MLNEGKRYLSIATLGLTVLGFMVYMGAKKREYGDKFKYLTFIFGKPACRGDPAVNPGYLRLLKHAFY